MSGAAKYASEEMKNLCVERATAVAGGTPGPTGSFDQLVAYLPDPLPTEAWGIWNKDGYLYAAKSADGMNAWYLAVDAAELPHYAMLGYQAEDNNGEACDVSGGEGAAMAAFISGAKRYFFVNGERFTQSGEREAEGHSYFVNCTGSNGRGAMCHFDTAGTGVSIFFFSSSQPVGTDERLGCPKTLPDFSSPPVDSRALPGLLAGFANETYAPFWAVAG